MADVESDAVAERSFHAKLLQIDGDLHQADIQALKFLLKDNLQKSKLAKWSSGHELFTGLETTKLITAGEPWLLIEVFRTIGRLDLIDYLDIDENKDEAIKRTGKISDYRHMMFDIAQDLTKEDTNKLAFLAEKISKAKREKLTSAIDLFSLMEELKMISAKSLDVLRDHLMSLNRHDLVTKLDQYCKGQSIEHVEPVDTQLRMESGNSVRAPPTPMEVTDTAPSLQTAPSMQTTLKADNGLPESIVLELSQELSKQPDCNVKDLWKGLGYEDEALQRLDESLKHLNKHYKYRSMLGSAPVLHACVDVNDGLIKFINALRFADMLPLSRQLVTKFKGHLPSAYQLDVERHTVGQDNMNVEISQGEARSLHSINLGGSSSSSMNSNVGQSDLIPNYKMDANPRGICVIFNNTEFTYDGSSDSDELKSRVGSNIDAGKLVNTFKKLHFIVRRYDNVPAVAMVRLLETVSSEIIGHHDCFVCCVLSHGKLGDKIYGADGHLIDVSDLQSPFKATRCPQLAGKPKLFFMQACQGQEKQEGIEVQSDVKLETDGPRDAVTVPNEADFLIGYATAPGFVSYRSKSQGSWYISILTELLDTHGTEHDLLTILTKVNQEVGKKQDDRNGRTYKQSPAPQYTLRKRLTFKKLRGESDA